MQWLLSMSCVIVGLKWCLAEARLNINNVWQHSGYVLLLAQREWIISYTTLAYSEMLHATECWGELMNLWHISYTKWWEFGEFIGTVGKNGKRFQLDINTTRHSWAVKQGEKGGCMRWKTDSDADRHLAYVLSPGWAVRGCWPSRPPHPVPCSLSHPQGKAVHPELSTCSQDQAGCSMDICGSPLQTHPEANRAIRKKKKEKKMQSERRIF